MSKFQVLKEELEAAIESTYQSGVTVQEAEALAAKFLFAQMHVSSELQKVDLDARMRKSGVKAVRAAVYIAVKQGAEKLTEAGVGAQIDTDTMVQAEQDGLDKAESSKAELERLYDIFTNGHIFMRGIAKGSFQ